MVLKRVIPCLDVDAGRVVKGTNFVGLRDAGDPVELAERYDAEGADELVFLDITASHEKRETIVELARRTADNVFIPFTIGGGIRSIEDAQAVLDAGADKVSVNSAALERPGAAGRARRPLRRPMRGDGDRRQAGGRRLGGVPERRPQAGRGTRRGLLGGRGGRARRRRDPSDQHGSRRHQRRLRRRADPGGRRRGPGPGDRLRRGRHARAPARGDRGRGRRRGPLRLDLPLRPVPGRARPSGTSPTPVSRYASSRSPGLRRARRCRSIRGSRSGRVRRDGRVRHSRGSRWSPPL